MLGFTFANAGLLYLLVLLIPVITWYVLKHNRIKAYIQISETDQLKNVITLKIKLRHVLFGLRMVALAFIILALARPQLSNRTQKINTEGIDIVIALDISGSMLSQDLKPSRIDAAKDVAIEFISGRPNDRIGLVVFSGESFTQCPLTIDHSVLINLFKDVKSGMIEDGTAIGVGLANAVNRLKESEAKTKVIILLTDGVNNRGSIAPMTAAEIAKTFNIRVYTVGIGTQGNAPTPIQTPFGIQYQNLPVKIDEAVLKNIATKTKGKYFRATDTQKLRDIYMEIDRLEKSKMKVTEESKHVDEYFWFGIIAGISILLELGFRSTIFKSIP